MKALTLHQPWAWLMLYGPKRIENRSWRPHASVIGQRVLVHQGKKWDAKGADYIRRKLSFVEFPDLAGAVGVLGSFQVDGYLLQGDAVPTGQEPWFFGPCGWLTSEPRVLPAPVAWRGALGLWTVPAELEALL